MRAPRWPAPAGPARPRASRPGRAARCSPTWPDGRPARPARVGRRAAAGAPRPARPGREPRPTRRSLGRAPRGGADIGRPRPGAPSVSSRADVGRGAGREQPRHRGVLRARRLELPGQPLRVVGQPRSAGSGQTPGREQDQLRPGCRHLPPLAPEAGPRGPGRGQGGLSVAAGELGQRQEQLARRPAAPAPPTHGPAGRRPPRTPRRAAQPPSAPGTGRARARPAGRPSARTRGRPRRTAGGPLAGRRCRRPASPWLCSARTASTSWPSDSKNRRASSSAAHGLATSPTSR